MTVTLSLTERELAATILLLDWVLNTPIEDPWLEGDGRRDAAARRALRKLIYARECPSGEKGSCPGLPLG